MRRRTCKILPFSHGLWQAGGQSSFSCRATVADPCCIDVGNALIIFRDSTQGASMEAEQPVRRASRAFVVFVVAMVAVMVFPLFAIGNRIEPMVLGLPFSMVWVVSWILIEFVVLVGFFLYEYGGSR